MNSRLMHHGVDQRVRVEVSIDKATMVFRYCELIPHAVGLVIATLKQIRKHSVTEQQAQERHAPVVPILDGRQTH